MQKKNRRNNKNKQNFNPIKKKLAQLEIARKK